MQSSGVSERKKERDDVDTLMHIVTILADKTINNKRLTDFDSQYFRLENKWPNDTHFKQN